MVQFVKLERVWYNLMQQEMDAIDLGPTLATAKDGGVKKLKRVRVERDREKEEGLQGDTEEVSTLLILIALLEFGIYAAALPIFLKDILYIPCWSTGLAGFLFYGYFLIEIGFLKVFYGFRNQQLVTQRLKYEEERQ